MWANAVGIIAAANAPVNRRAIVNSIRESAIAERPTPTTNSSVVTRTTVSRP